MSDRNIFVDTTTLLLAFGGASPRRPACQLILEHADTAGLHIHASTELVQEFLFHRLRRAGRAMAILESRAMVSTCVLHSFDQPIADRMIDLVESSAIRGRDAVHAATALAAGFDTIVSADTDFDGAPGLRRIDPVDWVASLP